MSRGELELGGSSQLKVTCHQQRGCLEVGWREIPRPVPIPWKVKVPESSGSREQRAAKRSPRSECAAPSLGLHEPLSFLLDPKGGLAGPRSVEADLGSQSDLLDDCNEPSWSKGKLAQRKLYVNEITHPEFCTSSSPRYHLNTWAFPFPLVPPVALQLLPSPVRVARPRVSGAPASVLSQAMQRGGNRAPRTDCVRPTGRLAAGTPCSPSEEQSTEFKRLNEQGQQTTSPRTLSRSRVTLTSQAGTSWPF